MALSLAGQGRACLLDETDLHRLARTARVTIHRIEGPHDLMDAQPEACRALIAAALERTDCP